MMPVFAIVGRPNVGKSTFFNCLTQSRSALVADQAGVTRDRLYGQGQWHGKSFVVIDTGGLGEIEESEKQNQYLAPHLNENTKKLNDIIAEQSWLAIQESDAVFFVLDGRAGLTSADQDIAKKLRHTSKPIFMVINKTEGLDTAIAITDFYHLGIGELYPIAAAHKRGISELLEAVFSSGLLSSIANSDADPASPVIPEQAGIHNSASETSAETLPVEKISSKKESSTDMIKLAIVGRPNVGKSTLVNRIVGEERVIVYDAPGTTRDSINVPLQRQGKQYVLIDTAGVRRRSRIHDALEKNSIVKTLQAIEEANVVLFLVDARQNIAEQDLHLLGFIIEAGKALVIAVNKWDKLPIDQKDEVRRELDRRLSFVDFAKIHFISARHGTGVGELFPSIDAAYRSATRKMTTPHLTRILEDALIQHQPPLVKGRRIKLRYAHPGGYNPPRIIIHGNQAVHLPHSYRRYLVNVFRKALKMEGTPIFVEVKSGENPYAKRKKKS